MKSFLEPVVEGKDLSEEEAARAFQIILNGGATPAQIAAFLTSLRIKGETASEIIGAASAMRAKMERVDAPEISIDVCGTGGDASGHGSTLNISTATALVVAACGLPVVKHGNRSVSSSSGSADVLAALGLPLQAGKKQAERALKEAGVCFLFAPHYHKALRHLAPIRQELGIRTMFHLLGPLVNPAMPPYQLLGVPEEKWLAPMAEALRALGSRAAWVVHGNDGLDELSIGGASKVAQLKDGEITFFEVHPEQAGLAMSPRSELAGSTPERNAQALRRLLGSVHTPYRDAVVLNAAAALMIAGIVPDLCAGAQMAADAIDSGRAMDVLMQLVQSTSEDYTGA